MKPDTEKHKQNSEEHQNPNVESEFPTQDLSGGPGSSTDATGEWSAEQLQQQSPALANEEVESEFPTQDIRAAPADSTDATGEWRAEQLQERSPANEEVESEFPTQDIPAAPASSTDATGEWSAEQLDQQAPATSGSDTDVTGPQPPTDGGTVAFVPDIPKSAEDAPRQSPQPSTTASGEDFDSESTTQDISDELAGPTDATGEWCEAEVQRDRTLDFGPGDSASQPVEAETLDRPAEPADEHKTGAQPPADRTQQRADRPAQTRDGEGRATQHRATAAGGESAPLNRVGRYAMNKFHAKGGMGEIWLAQDLDIGRSVAYKKMREGCAKEGFVLEAQVTGQLEHPGIVPVHELGTDSQGQPFYVMKFVQGRTLSDVIKEHHAADTAAGESREVRHVRLLQMFVNLCQTIAYAHSRAVIHRDLKPDNVMVGSYGETLVLDWGLAKVVGAPEADDANAPEGIRLSGDTMETRAGSIKGSPTYMAPESARGDVAQVDQKSDIFLLGGILYTMLTGKPPRSGEKLRELLKRSANEAPAPPRTLDPTIPKPINAICAKALALEKEDRYESAQALAEDVERYLAGEPVSAYQENFLERAARWCKRHRTAIVRTVAAAAVVLLAVYGVTKYREMEAEAARRLREVELLQKQETARLDLNKFRDLADRARYFAANSDPATENAPFFDVEQGVDTAKAALAIVQPWGARFRGLPIENERQSLEKEVHELLLLLAHLKSQQGDSAEEAQEVLSFLKWADQLHESTRGYHRLRAWALRVQGDNEAAAGEDKRAEDAGTPTTALDHFLLGEQFRIEATRSAKAPSPGQEWLPDEEILAKAIEEYGHALDIDPKNYWSHFQLGRCYLSQGKASEAVKALGTCVALRPKSPWGYSARGLALVELKQYEEAKADLDKAIALAPDFRPPRLNRGVVSMKLKDFDAALRDFDAVLQPPSEKRLIQAAYYRGHLYLEKKEFQKALAEFNLVAKERNRIRQVHLLRAQIFFFDGKNEEGLQALNDYLSSGEEFDPDSAEAYERRGRHLRLLAQEFQNPQRRLCILLALEQLEKSVQLGGKTALLFDNLGAAKESLGSYQDAVKAYTNAIDAEPKNVRLLVKRGWANGNLRPPDYAAAKADFSAALEIEPDHAEAHSGLGYVQASFGRIVEAQRQANLAVLYGGGDYLILHNVACIYAKLSDLDAKQTKSFQDLAIDQLRRAVDLWKKGGAGPSELLLMQYEPAFSPALKARPEFQKLLKGERHQG